MLTQVYFYQEQCTVALIQQRSKNRLFETTLWML